MPTATRRKLAQGSVSLNETIEQLNKTIKEEETYLGEHATCRADIRIEAGILRWSPGAKELIVIDDEKALPLRSRKLKTRQEAAKNFERLEMECYERMATRKASVTRTLNVVGNRAGR